VKVRCIDTIRPTSRRGAESCSVEFSSVRLTSQQAPQTNVAASPTIGAWVSASTRMAAAQSAVMPVTTRSMPKARRSRDSSRPPEIAPMPMLP